MVTEKKKTTGEKKTESKIDPVFGILGDLAVKIAAEAVDAHQRNVGAFFVEAIDYAAKGKKFTAFDRYSIKLKK